MKIAKALHQAHRRGSRFITAEDLIFLIRKNKEKCNRLRVYLSWKDVRKNVKDKEAPAFDEVMEDAMLEKDIRTRQKMIKFSWELLADYTNNLDDDEELNEGEESAFQEQKQRLRVGRFSATKASCIFIYETYRKRTRPHEA